MADEKNLREPPPLQDQKRREDQPVHVTNKNQPAREFGAGQQSDDRPRDKGATQGRS